MTDATTTDATTTATAPDAAAKAAAAPLTVALVGCGVIATNHVRALALQGDAVVTHLVDPLPEARAQIAGVIAAETGWPAPVEHDGLDALLAAPDRPELVVILVPSGLHAELAEQAIAAGVHVVIEKPVDVTAGRARRLLAAAEAASTASDGAQVVTVISQHRFDPASIVVADAAHGGRLGHITSAVASVPWFRSQDYYDSGDWRGTWALDGGGSTMNQGVHTVDLLVWFLGRPVAVTAYTGLLAHERVEVEDTAAAIVRFESGALAVLHTTTAAFPGLQVRLAVYGARGSAVIENDQLEYFYAEPDEGIDPAILGDTHVNPTRLGPRNQAADLVEPNQLRGNPHPDDAFPQGHRRQYDDVVAAIRAGRPAGVGVRDALLSLAVVQALYASATLGREVLVSEVLDGAYDGLVLATGTVDAPAVAPAPDAVPAADADAGVRTEAVA